MTAPARLTRARGYIGFHEAGSNQGIEQFVEMAHCGAPGEPWCAIFANAMLEASGYRGTRSALARSFEHDLNFTRLPAPQLGAIVTYWRGPPSSGEGPGRFLTGTDAAGRLPRPRAE